MIDKKQLQALKELQEKLQEKGVSMNTWGKTEERKSENPILNKQLTMWSQMSELLEEQVKKDQSKVAELQEMIDRLKHGGGR